MKCPKCQTDNPDSRKFCRECGAKFLLLCPQCGSGNFPGDKFCGECGQNLTHPSEPASEEQSFCKEPRAPALGIQDYFFMMFHLGRDYELYARLLKKKGDLRSGESQRSSESSCHNL
ncbi:MAG: zinc ribbon domain-containing protein [Deltaproteobacteria bacterium]|nr:zinc ribbon domain-containing protein [Deltaproteobacteria bacterium]